MIDAVRSGADGIISVAANAYQAYEFNYIQLYGRMINQNHKIFQNKTKFAEFVLNNFFQLIFDEGTKWNKICNE